MLNYSYFTSRFLRLAVGSGGVLKGWESRLGMLLPVQPGAALGLARAEERRSLSMSSWPSGIWVSTVS